MTIDRSNLGPVEILAVAFPGSRFTGEIVPALQELVDGGIIRILDLVLVAKDGDGNVTILEIDELTDDATVAFRALEIDGDSLLNDEDLDTAADELEPGDSAAVLVWEDRWAARLANAIRNADGRVLALERVPAEAVDELLDALADV
jgi:uncharacterized membrane protein